MEGHGPGRKTGTKDLDWKTGTKKIWERVMWVSPLWKGKRSERNLCSKLTLTKKWPQKSKILIIKWIRWRLWRPVSLSPQPPIVAQWAHEQSGHGGRDGCYAWVYQYELTLTKANLATTWTDCPICQQERTPLSRQYGIVPVSDQSATWSQWITSDHFHQERSNLLFLLE